MGYNPNISVKWRLYRALGYSVVLSLTTSERQGVAEDEMHVHCLSEYQFDVPIPERGPPR